MVYKSFGSGMCRYAAMHFKKTDRMQTHRTGRCEFILRGLAIALLAPPRGGDGQEEVEALLDAEHHERDHHQLQVLLYLLDRGLPAGRSLQLRMSRVLCEKGIKFEVKGTQ